MSFFFKTASSDYWFLFCHLLSIPCFDVCLPDWSAFNFAMVTKNAIACNRCYELNNNIIISSWVHSFDQTVFLRSNCIFGQRRGKKKRADVNAAMCRLAFVQENFMSCCCFFFFFLNILILLKRKTIVE